MSFFLCSARSISTHSLVLVLHSCLAFPAMCCLVLFFFFFFQAEDGIRDHCVTGVQTCALPISPVPPPAHGPSPIGVGRSGDGPIGDGPCAGGGTGAGLNEVGGNGDGMKV